MHKPQKIITIITLALIVIVTATSITAMIVEDGGAPYSFTSLRGEEIEIYGGAGMYGYNTVEYALMMRAYDWCYLVLAIPLMIIGLILYLRKSYIGYFILLSVFFFIFYSFFINSFAIAYNSFFLVYIVVFAFSAYAIIYMIKDVSFEHLRLEVMPKLPTKTIFVVTLLLALYFVISWMVIDLSSLFTGAVHPDVDIYTTAGFNVVDLSIYVPLSITAMILLSKRKPLGAILSVMLILMVPQTMSALSIYMFMNVQYHQESIMTIEFPLVVFAVVGYFVSFLSLRKLKGIQPVYQK